MNANERPQSGAGEQMIHVAIRAEKLESLFAGNQLCAADLRCRNPETKALIHRICLSRCLAGG